MTHPVRSINCTALHFTKQYKHPTQGLQRALARMSECGQPIYITETGVADRQDKGTRDLMIRSYSQEVVKAIHAGVDVRGFMYWTLVDNFGAS